MDNWKPKASLALITTALMLATFVDVLNTSIANVALKYIAGSFSVSDDESLWIVTMFLIACSVFLPATDWFCSVFGRKKFFLFCIALFGISATVCGFAPNFEIMLLARFCQGLGGGCLIPLSQAILLESYPKHRQGEAMAIFSTGVTIAPIIGPILGGYLTNNYSWNWVFFISIPFCIAAFVMVAMYIEDPPYLKVIGFHKMDHIGFFLLVVWIASFQIMVDNGQKNGWFDSAYITKLGITSLIAFALFIWRELKARKPLLDLSIVKNRNFTLGTIALTVGFAVAYGTIAILPQFLQRLMGYDSFLSGLAAGPMGVGSVLAVICSALLANKVDWRAQSFLGFMVFAIGCYIFSTLSLNISFGNVVIPNIILGFGMTTFIIPTTTLIFSNVSNIEMTNAASVQNLIKNVGCAVGTSSVGVFVSRFSQVHQTYLVDKLTALNTVFAERISAMTANFMQHGVDIATAGHMAQIMIYRQLSQQSTLSAFMTSYKIYAIIMLCILPIIFFMKKIDYSK